MASHLSFCWYSDPSPPRTHTSKHQSKGQDWFSMLCILIRKETEYTLQTVTYTTIYRLEINYKTNKTCVYSQVYSYSTGNYNQYTYSTIPTYSLILGKQWNGKTHFFIHIPHGATQIPIHWPTNLAHQDYTQHIYCRPFWFKNKFSDVNVVNIIFETEILPHMFSRMRQYWSNDSHYGE